MKTQEMKNMIRGWFVGNFEPSVHQTSDVEVAVKQYKAGDYEQWHYHKIGTEITAIINGEVEMNGKRYQEGEIIVIEPGEGTDFLAVTDVTNVVVKIPGANNDKYLEGE